MTNTESHNHSKPDHEMPPMGEGLMSWGFAGFFILPVILIVLVFLVPQCADVQDGATFPENQTDTVQPTPSEEN